MKRPLALLVNDDGIFSTGIRVLYEHLREEFDCVITGPNKEKSGIGKALTVNEVVKVEEAKLYENKAYIVYGTPADAVLLALNKLLYEKPDIVVAGVNLGPNLGIDDILNSGTVGAAIEAAVHGIPSIAVSYCISRRFDDNVDEALQGDVGLKLSAKIALVLAKAVVDGGLPKDVDLLSVNVPDHRAGIKGVKVTKPSKKGYPDIHLEGSGGYRIAKWDLSLYPKDNEDTDVEAVRSGYVSLSPLNISLTSSLGDVCLKRCIEIVEEVVKRIVA
ncbi:MAG: 5'/3'-nucleotidase SurE [Candidatus Nezhaarchaeota archaeon]|nr:5'/3'-nucleotidase SurE [Candidatus Nezhaarchaeota archaeon]